MQIQKGRQNHFERVVSLKVYPVQCIRFYVVKKLDDFAWQKQLTINFVVVFCKNIAVRKILYFNI